MKADRSRKNGRAQKSKNRRKRPCQAAQGMPRRRYRRGRWNAERGSSAQNRFESGGGCAIIKLSAARQGAAYCRWGESRMKKNGRRWLWVVLAAVLLAVAGFGIRESRRSRPHSAMGFAMDTVVTQTAYGPQAEAGTQAVTRCLAQLEARLSLYVPTSELAAVNAAAGRQPVAVSDDTFALLAQTLALSARSQGAFQATIAPLTQLWGITGEHPSVPSAAAIAAVLPLIDDSSVLLDADAHTVYLPQAGQALDLGGIAKGYACDAARQAYAASGVQHALLSVGGNICAVGGRPDGQPFRIGFRDPDGGAESYLASFLLRDGVAAVSGGYERYFEQDGVRYHHILDPQTGWPAVTDVVSVGVIGDNGAEADFWSTTLFCWGRERALEWMRTAEQAVILLDDAGVLYVSASLEEGFCTEREGQQVVFVEAADEALDG